MGTMDAHFDDFDADDRRAEVIDWLGGLLPDFHLPLDSTDEELRAYLVDGTALCYTADKVLPGVQVWGGYASDHRSKVMIFLSIIAEMGLPGFSVNDLEEGSMSSVVECLLALRDSVPTGSGENISNYAAKTPTRPVVSVSTPGRRSPGEDRRRIRSPLLSGQKVNADLPATKISEMTQSNSLDNAATQALLSVVDESIEGKRGEIPHRLLRKAIEEIDHHISMQAYHIRNQNHIIKTRDEKYRSKIKALETLVDGTNEEIKVEKSKIDESRKLCEQDMVRLMQEKENAENKVTKLEQEIQVMSRMLEDYREQMEAKKSEMEENLTQRTKDAAFHLMQSQKRVEELEAAFELKSQLWSKKTNTFQSFMDNHKLSIKDIRISSKSIKQEILALQMKCSNEISNIGLAQKGLVDALLAENKKLFNEVQELKGNIRVYCRVRPFLAGQEGKSTTVDYIGENGEILISNPFKQGKDGHRMFKFNKVFNLDVSQAEVFADIQPLIRSVLEGFNVCIFAYGQTGSGKTYTMSGPGTSKEDRGVNYRALNELFDISLKRRNTFSYEVEVQIVEIYNEQVRDLLSKDSSQKKLEIWSTSQANGLVVPDASLIPVKSTSEVLQLMETGQRNRAVGSTALNERSSRSHSILTVHVRGLDVKNGSTSRGMLHLIDLAGSERVDQSGATGDRLREAQHINKSLSALGDVISALAQKNQHVPYRNSKLTHILESSLGGKAKTLMLVQINPDVESWSETTSTLKFAERVSAVELGAARSNREGTDRKDALQIIEDKTRSPSSQRPKPKEPVPKTAATGTGRPKLTTSQETGASSVKPPKRRVIQ